MAAGSADAPNQPSALKKRILERRPNDAIGRFAPRKEFEAAHRREGPDQGIEQDVLAPRTLAVVRSDSQPSALASVSDASR